MADRSVIEAPFWLNGFSWALSAAAFTGAMATVQAWTRSAGPLSANLDQVRLELPTMQLLATDLAQGYKTPPVLIVAPLAVHDASMADFAPGHSLVEVLLREGVTPLAITAWKSASDDISGFGVDAYLGSLDLAVDELGGHASLVGLCQGGWLAAAYAARFPEKVRGVALVGAPLDLKAAESSITRALSVTPPPLIESYVALGGGRVWGAASLAFWFWGSRLEREAAQALQCEPDPGLRARFDAWNARAVDLPGRFFVETAEWMFRENRLAEGDFPALGRRCGLADITAPLFVLATEDDQVVALEQARAAQRRCSKAHVDLRIAKGAHLSLFMGAVNLRDHWPELARWLIRQGAPG